MRLKTTVLLWLGLLLWASEVAASSPVTWEHPPRPGGAAAGLTTTGEKILGVAVDRSGSLTLSIPRREIFPAGSEIPAPQILWTAHVDFKGNLYLGGGNAGQIFMLDRKGVPTTKTATDELGVRALASNLTGDVFAASFPNGAVYKIDPDGKVEPYYETDERYLWATAADQRGNLFLATGERGILYRITDQMEGSVLFDSDEAHIVSLVLDGDDRILAGTDPGGLLYGISMDGSAEVILDTDLREVSAMTVSPDGVIYAAAISEAPPRPFRQPSTPGDLTIEVTPSSDGGTLEDPINEPTKITIDLAELLPPPTAGAEGTTGRIYRIDPGESPSLVWSSDSQRVYSLAYEPQHGLLFGTGRSGPEGDVYRLEPDGSATLLYRFDEPQVTSLVPTRFGGIYACTSNPGRVYLLEDGSAASGTYTSSVLDAGRQALWGAVSWDADLPPGTRVELTTRSGNRASPDDTWSPWSGPYAVAEGSKVTSRPARYLQWKAELSRIKTDQSPRIRRVKITLLPENRKPKLEGVAVLAPRAAWRKPGTASGPSSSKEGQAGEGSGDLEPPEGKRWVVWSSGDPDDDELRHTLWIRGREEEDFRIVDEDAGSPPYALSDADLPEGRYRVKVEVDDSRANGPAVLSDSASSDSFLVDHTPPELETRRPGSELPAGRLVIEVLAADAGLVASGQYSLGDSNPESWQELRCEDGICDTSSEVFRVNLEDPLPAGRLRVRVYDAAGNASVLELPRSAMQGGT